MKIMIWSDFQCPFCYMGEKMLEQALGKIVLTEPVEIEYRAYQLDPKAPAEPQETMTDHFMAGHTLTLAEAQARMQKITEMAKDAGLIYNLTGVKVCNTMDAHRLMKFAATKLSLGKLKRLNFSIFKANFEENKLLSDHEVLADLGETVGLDRNETLEMLAGDAFTEEVHKDDKEIDARPDFEFVPYMLLATGAVLQGVMRESSLQRWLEAAMNDGATALEDDVPREGCGPGGCSV